MYIIEQKLLIKITLYPNITGNYTIDQLKDNQYYINWHFLIDSKKLINKVSKSVENRTFIIHHELAGHILERINNFCKIIFRKLFT